MSEASSPRFMFSISGLPEETFQVVQFTGKEGLSTLYEFDILLATARRQRMDLDAVQTGRARLTMHRPGKEDLAWNGMVRDIELLERNHGLTFCRATLVPRAWWLTQIRTTQIFLETDLHQMLEDILRQAGLQPGLDQEFRLCEAYTPREWTCQYGETHWNFFSRHMERYGLYCFFEQGADREKLVVTDTCLSHTELPGGQPLAYRPSSGLMDPGTTEYARTFRATLRQLPKDVLIQDYNYRTCKTFQVSHAVGGHGIAGVYAYEADLRSAGEAKRLARIKAEGLACKRLLFQGETTAPFLRPGFTFQLTDYFQPDINNKHYTTVDLIHEGHQEAAFSHRGTQANGDKPFYRNRFSAIPAKVQYRPETRTPVPKVAGPLTAWIDGEGDGRYAEVDAMGRYKVRFPMDLSGRADGQASHWIRMITPYSGEGHGLHLPLHKGTEVLVLFRNGNPDKPVIAGAVANQVQKMVVNQDNHTQCRLTTAGGNLLHIEDMEGSQRFLIQSPVRNSWVRIGAPNDPPAPVDWDWSKLPTKEGIALATGGSFSVNCQVWNTITLGEQSSTTVGAKESMVLGETLNVSLGGRQDVIVPRKVDFTPKRGTIEIVTDAVHSVRRRLSAREQVVVAEQQEQVVAEQVEVVAEQQQFVGEQVEAVAEQQNVVAVQVAVVAEQDIVVAEQEVAVADQQQVVAVQEVVVAEQQLLVGAQNNLAGEQNNQAGEVVNMAAEVIDMVDDQVNLGECAAFLFGAEDHL